MKAIQNLICKSLLLFFLGTMQCSNDSVSNIDGSGSSTETAMISGTFYYKDGSFAKNTKVFIRKKNTLAEPSVPLSEINSALFKKQSATADTVTTDNHGEFLIDSIDVGTYVIEGTDDKNNYVLIDSVQVTNPDSTVILPSDTLKPSGAIKGTIHLSEGEDPRKVFVLSFGIDRFARVNADGTFLFSPLAEGSFDLRFISTLDDYEVLDTLNIPVTSNDTINIGSIHLPFTGIPTPKNVMIQYDSLKQIVTLSWNKTDSNLVNSYNVYRRNVDDNSVINRLNTSPVNDTFFLDSSVQQSRTYEYYITSVDRNNNEGIKSQKATVMGEVAFFISDTLFTTEGFTRAVAFDKNNNFIFIQSKTRFQTDAEVTVKRYTFSGIFLNSWNIRNGFYKESSAKHVEVDDSNHIIIINNFGELFKFDSTGNLLDSFTTCTLGEFDIFHDTIFIVNYESKNISVFTTNGDSLFTFGQFNNYSPSILCDSNGHVYVKELVNGYIKLQVFGKDGSFINSVNFDPVTMVSVPDIGNSHFCIKDSLLILSNFKHIYCFQTTGKLIWRSPLFTHEFLVFYDPSGKIRAALPTGEIVTIDRW